MRIVDISLSPNTRSMLIDAEFAMACMRAEGGGLIKFVLSTENGSVSRKKELRAHLRKALKNGSIKQLIFGENFSSSDKISRFVCDFYPEAEQDPDFDAGNSNITIVRI